MDYAFLFLLEIVWILGEIDPPPLAPCFRLYDKGLKQFSLLTLAHIVIDFRKIRREEKGPWEVVILSWKLILHLCQGECERILPGDDAHRREVIDALIVRHSLQCFIDYSSIAPFELPVTRFPKIFGLPGEAVSPANLLQNGVLCICIIAGILARLTMTCCRPL